RAGKDRARRDRRSDQGEAVRPADRDRGGSVQGFLFGREVSSGVLQEECGAAILPVRDLAQGRQAQEALRRPLEALNHPRHSPPTRDGMTEGPDSCPSSSYWFTDWPPPFSGVP